MTDHSKLWLPVAGVGSCEERLVPENQPIQVYNRIIRERVGKEHVEVVEMCTPADPQGITLVLDKRSREVSREERYAQLCKRQHLGRC